MRRRFPGGLKQRTAQEQFAKDPSSILREAVLGMLPKNNLRKVSRLGTILRLRQRAVLSGCHTKQKNVVYAVHMWSGNSGACCSGPRSKAADISVLRASVSRSPTTCRLAAKPATTTRQGAAVGAAGGL